MLLYPEEIKQVAKEMNDLYQELIDTHDFTGSTASQFVASFFHGGRGQYKED